MRYAVVVDPETLATGAQRLSATADALGALADRVLALCVTGGSAAAAPELSVALHDAGWKTARAVAGAANAVDALATRTQLAGEDYRLLEQLLSSRWDAPGATQGWATSGRGYEELR
jgi:hypothetical protein